MPLAILSVTLVIFTLSCAASQTRLPVGYPETGLSQPDREVRREELFGEASWYGDRFHGRTTANGEQYDMYAFTAAHKTLPFDTVVRVVRRETRQSVVVRINDRGPYSDGRIIDLSRAAAEEIGMIDAGVVDVYLEILSWGG